MNKNYINKKGKFDRYTVKILLIMRLTTVIMLLAILQASAHSHAQQLTCVGKNVVLSEVSKAIKKQTGFNVIYSDRQIDIRSRAEANFSNVKIDAVLKNDSLTYTINRTNIIIKPPYNTLQEGITQPRVIIDVHGKVTDSLGTPLRGATIKVKNKKEHTITNDNGEFYLWNIDEGDIIIISYVGYNIKQVRAKKELGEIKLELSSGDLSEVAIISTGYQTLPKERATGSVTTIDEKILNRSVGVNILDRLDGVTSGLLFSKTRNAANTPKISIHGRSTIMANAEPLIVLDGFPYDGNINQINPADISSINLLKDAAASSIWGARSGNGVIVITTKRGKNNQKLAVEITSTVTIGNKPDQYYIPQMTSSEFIELEQILFNRGFYNSRFNNAFNFVTPAVEIFNQRKNNRISAADSASRINELKSHDLRKELDEHFFRPQNYQQYAVNMSGGGENHRYYLSGGYNKNLENQVASSYDRMTLKANNSFNLIKDKLELFSHVDFISSHNKSGNSYTPLTPYDHLVDAQGKALAVARDFRMSYADTAGNNKLLDWHYRPYDELRENYNLKTNQYRIKAGLNYKITGGLNLISSYQFLYETRNGELEDDINSYRTRIQINRFSSINGNGVNRIIPMGSLLDESKTNLTSKIFRAQLNYNKLLAKDHEINAIAGYEGSDNRSNSAVQSYFGYNPETKMHANGSINPTNFYRYYYGTFEGARIRTAPILNGTIDINQSFFANASYAYKQRYIISGSARRDESNLFGVETNQKGVPLWSAGLAWNVNKEPFYRLQWLSLLKLRATYGLNGNVDRSTSAYLSALIPGVPNLWGSNYALIINPNNPNLRWEQVKTLNFGLDFSSLKNRISGSLDVYNKKNVDLIGDGMTSYQSGITTFRGNTASLETNGLDLVLNTQNLTGKLGWSTDFLFNYNLDNITKFVNKPSSNSIVVNNSTNSPVVDFPYNAIFSFPSAGLDNLGRPQGYYNGEKTINYAELLNAYDLNQVKYHGPASPKYFGSLRNTVNYKNVELSFNITYKFAYFFKRTNVFSGNNFGSASATAFNLSDFSNRWQKPGDESFTSIPALTYPSNTDAINFYNRIEDLVEKGNHIRLQDVRLSYNLVLLRNKKLPFKAANFFVYSRNLGVLWKASKLDLDPDYGTSAIPEPFSMSFGLNINLNKL